MASVNTPNDPGGPSAARPIEQLLVMHCLKEDSVLGREGFSVRAVSPGAGDRATLDWAMRLDRYELPMDMRSGTLLANQTPRRLALVPGPTGQWALIHTAYLPEDTVGRTHSFISQVLLLPEVSTLAAVTAWGASDWWTDEYPRGETMSLPPLDEIPRGALLDDAILADFLSGAPAPADQSLARTVFPGRVDSNPQARRRWVRAALHAFLLTAEAGSQRSRVCILAEPGAVALLVYAIARLLPPQLTDAFAFSTYEPSHTTLRDNRVARVIGAFARNGIDRAESDPLRRRGYVVDTFRDAYGPDLMIEPSWPLEGLLDCAAQGDWAAVDEIREFWSRDAKVAQGATPAMLSEAVRLRHLAAAPRAGTIATEGLIELPPETRPPLGGKDAGEASLRAPTIGSGAWKGLGKRFRGRLRPYAAAFGAGCLVTALASSSLRSPVGGSQDSHPGTGATKTEAARHETDKVVLDLKAQLRQSESALAEREKQLAATTRDLRARLEERGIEIKVLRAEIAQRRSKPPAPDERLASKPKATEQPIRPAQPPAPPRADVAAMPPRTAEPVSTTSLVQLREILDVKGLGKDNVAVARGLARRIRAEETGGKQDRPLATTMRLLAGLGTADVPALIRGKSESSVAHPSDFSFIHSSTNSRSVLATSSPWFERAIYGFEVDDDRLNWTRVLTHLVDDHYQNYMVFSTSPSGDFALFQRTSEPRSRERVRSDRLFAFLFRDEKLVTDFESAETDPQPNARVLCISNGGEKLGMLTRWDGATGVYIRPFGGDRPILRLGLRQVAGELAKGHAISRMSFDAMTRTCAISMNDSNALLLFRLDGPDGAASELEPHLLKERHRVIDWGYRPDGGSLAVGSQRGVSFYDLQQWPPRILEALAVKSDGTIRSIAFSPRGAYLAVGYHDGVVETFDLRAGSRKVLRLRHEGPVIKLGFSPDGRVLAVLFQSPEEMTDRSGSIRLWITRDWERDEKGAR